ncbi:hypothetical protein Vadar_002753 [Vaccinium darrowii]|uniref:Uncharacterized protein n=1 Tax=Vaccinium darrowii TaxID=229202 RepID=A0ACB7XXN8_9ERIC|nr:hypothetical protein Vadar_002753 [Vaccinium darrowii]
MATLSKFSAILSIIIIFFGNLNPLFSENLPTTISASPAVSLYATAPNMTSFFPSPRVQQPPKLAAAPSLEALSPIPSSGEFIGKSSSGSATVESRISIFGLVVYFVF